MIRGDYLFSNYMCRIAVLMNGRAYSEGEVCEDCVVLKLRNIEMFFRYSEEDGFIAENKYGEEPTPESYSLLGAILQYAIWKNDMDIKWNKRINGRVMKITMETLANLALLDEMMRISELSGRVHVPEICNNCPLREVCWMEPIKIPSTNETYPGILPDMLGRAIRITLASGESVEKAAIMLLDGKFRKVRSAMNEGFLAVANDIGYHRAMTVKSVAHRILFLYQVPKMSIDVREYGGYLKRCGDYVLPTDRFWKAYLHEELESVVDRIYTPENIPHLMGDKEDDAIWWV